MGPLAHRLALESAAHGLVSGTLSEWPVLAAALRAAGRPLPNTARTEEMRAAARAALGEEAPMGRGNCCEHCGEVGQLRADVAGAKATLDAVSSSVNRIEKALVTRAEFNPVRALVFGLVGIVMTAFVVNLMK